MKIFVGGCLCQQRDFMCFKSTKDSARKLERCVVYIFRKESTHRQSWFPACMAQSLTWLWICDRAIPSDTLTVRRQALHVAITTAGTDRNSICFELHTKALDLLAGRKVDPTFYPVVYSLPDGDDWREEKNWYKVNPSLGYTVPIERIC